MAARPVPAGGGPRQRTLTRSSVRPSPSSSSSSDQGERGSAVAETVLVGALVVVLVLGIVQLAYALWVRTVLIDAAAEGARHAALLDGDLASGEDRALLVAATGISATYVDGARAQVQSAPGYDVVVMEITAPVPIIGLLGPSGTMTVTGRAVVEQ